MHNNRMLVCDIDDTLLRDGAPTRGLGPFKSLIATRAHNVYLVYASGRSFESLRALIDNGVLPEPDALAPSIGTEIWLPPWTGASKTYRSWVVGNWPRKQIESVVESFPGLRLQEAQYQTAAKISYYVEDHRSFHLAALEDVIDDHGIDARLVYSCGQFLDVLPAGAGKRSAVTFLRRLWNIDGADVVVCGDSGNDIDMLADPAVNAVVVGNAQPELDAITAMSHVYQSELPYAAGVLEGTLVHGLWTGLGRARRGIRPAVSTSNVPLMSAGRAF